MKQEHKVSYRCSLIVIAIAEEIQGLQISITVISEIVGDVHTE